MSSPLAGKRVLVTRPEHQANELCTLLEQQGATPIRLPLLSIEPTSTASPLFHQVKQHILDLDLFQHVIFISPNAVTQGYDWIDQYWPQLPLGVNWYGIGQKTTSLLGNYGIDAYHSPVGYDSEALLACEALQQIEGDKVLIMRGEGGRETLANELRARGAEVRYAELYRRCTPDYADEQLTQAFKPLPDAILISSGEGLENLLVLSQQCSQLSIDSLKHCHFIVPSERVKDIANQMGFTRITTATGPDDHSMIEALI